MARGAADALFASGATVAVSESSSGGLVAAALLSIPNASRYFQGGAVVYTHRSRAGLLCLDETLPAGMRASTEGYAILCAEAARERLGTTWSVAETGAAGPSGNRYGDPAGHSCIAVCGPVPRAATIETRSANREANMWVFARATLELLRQCVAEHGGK